MNAADRFLLGAIAFLAVVVYFLPLTIAICRHHRQMWPIIVVDVFLGWSLVGWVVALAWSVSKDTR